MYIWSYDVQLDNSGNPKENGSGDTHHEKGLINRSTH